MVSFRCCCCRCFRPPPKYRRRWWPERWANFGGGGTAADYHLLGPNCSPERMTAGRCSWELPQRLAAACNRWRCRHFRFLRVQMHESALERLLLRRRRLHSHQLSQHSAGCCFWCCLVLPSPFSLDLKMNGKSGIRKECYIFKKTVDRSRRLF